MEHGVHRLAGAKHSQHTLGSIQIGEMVKCAARSDGGITFSVQEGNEIGYLTSRHTVAQALGSGATVLHCSVNSIRQPTAAKPHLEVSVRIVTGSADEHYRPPPVYSAQTYRVGLSGESFYQSEIAECREGDPVLIYHEADNPFDPLALSVRTMAGESIGYVPKSSWLKTAVFDEGKPVSATILGLYPGVITNVVLNVWLDGPALQRRLYRTPELEQQAKPLQRDHTSATESKPFARHNSAGFFRNLLNLIWRD